MLNQVLAGQPKVELDGSCLLYTSKQIYEKRLNTINRYVKRGALDADLAEVMKKLAKDKMLRALSNVAVSYTHLH